MARVNLTATRLHSFTCPPDKPQAFLWDTQARQLAVRATPRGRPAYVFQSRYDGRDIRITIGEAADWSIPQARERARELQAMIDRGLDPRVEIERHKLLDKQERRRLEQERQRQVLEATPALVAWQQYLDERRPAWGEDHHKDHIRMSAPGSVPRKRGGVTRPGPLRELLELPLARLDAQAIERWAHKHAPERPTMARLALRLLKAFLNWCRTHPEFRHVTPSESPITRKARETLGPAKAKTDALQREQLAAWFKAVQRQSPVIGAYLQALLLTGARPGELLGLRWADVDFQWGTLAIRDKVEGARAVPLTPYVASLLRGLPRSGAFVFMSGKTEGPIASPNHQALRVCRAAGIPPVTLHGLRRSFGTLAEWVEVPTGVVAQIMGHKPSATAERHYRVRPIDLLRMWHTKIEAWILEQAGIAQPASAEPLD